MQQVLAQKIHGKFCIVCSARVLWSALPARAQHGQHQPASGLFMHAQPAAAKSLKQKSRHHHAGKLADMDPHNIKEQDAVKVCS
jgi:hypothetical protein